jgi:peptidyl-prolyl cis-trans isomerase D
MATLEKIRSKSVLLLVIIGLALLAFIVGDFFTSGRTLFGTGTTVAKVGGQKIDVQEFQQRVEQANQQVQQSGRKIDQAVLQQQVLSAMVSEKLFKEEMEKLGLKVTDAELTDAMLGSGSFYLDGMLRQQGIQSASALHDMAYNPVNYGIDEASAAQLRQYWKSLETQMEESLLRQKFNTLFMGTLTANELDAKALYDENAATVQVAYAMKDFSSLSDDDYAVSDSELQDEWQKNKQNYLLDEPQRAINYIAVEIAPSADDITAAEKAVENAIDALKAQPSTEGLVDMPDFVVNRNKVAAASILDARLKKFADTTSVGNAALVSRIGNDFTLAKLIGKSVETDSMNINIFAIRGSRATADSITRELNAGRISFDSLSTIAGVESVQRDLALSLLDPQVAAMRDALASATVGTYFIPDTTSSEGAVIVKVNSRKAPVAVYDLAEVHFTAEPSRATVNKLEADLQTFINNNKTAADFVANAAEAGFQTFPTIVSTSSPQIDNLPSSRAAVHWAMDAKKGSVSPIFGEETDGRFIAVALTDIYDKYVPATAANVNTYLTSEVRNNKKAAALIDQYKGKANDLAGYAQLMGTKVDTTSVNFGQLSIYNPGVGGPDFAATVSVTEPGKLTGPVKGSTGVVVFNVVNVDKEGRPYSFEENAINFNRSRGAAMLNNNLQLLLLGNKKIENNLMKFFRD